MKRRVLFIINELTIYEHAGIMQLSAVAKAAGHETRLGIADTDDLAAMIRDWQPDVVAFSVLTGEQSFYLDLCRRLKRQVSFLSVFGGLHVTFCPEEFLREDCVDVLCLGEADEVFGEFLDKLGTDDLHSVDNLLAEMKEVAANYPTTFIRFDDNIIRLGLGLSALRRFFRSRKSV